MKKTSKKRVPHLSRLNRVLVLLRDTIIEGFDIDKENFDSKLHRSEPVKFNNKIYFTAGGFGFAFENYVPVWQNHYPFEISAFLYDGENIFVGNTGKGGARLYRGFENIRYGQFYHFLEGHTISHIIQDQYNGYWFGTNENSIFYCPNLSYLIYDKTMELSEDFITAVEVKNKHEIFIGLKNGEVYLLNTLYNKISKIYSVKDNTSTRPVFDLLYDSQEDALWKGSNGLTFYQNEKWTPTYGLTPDGEKKQKIWFGNKKLSLSTNSKTLWACNDFTWGFVKVNVKTGEFIYNSGNQSNVLKKRTLKVFEGKDNQVWLGRIDGLFQFKNDSIIPFKTLHSDFGLRVEDIAQMKDSSLVVATKGGGVLLILNDNKVLQISQQQGLTASMTECLHVDDYNNIWVGTLNGLNKISFNNYLQYNIEQITTANGLPSNEINDIDSQGNIIWVATTHGLAKIPSEQKKNLVSKPPFIEQIRINGNIYDRNTLNQLSYDQNNLEIQFLVINYKLNGRINYRYRLRSNQEWTYTQNRIVNFSALASSDYKFEVQAQNEDGIWSPSTNLLISINPPFWKTWWFWGGLILLILSLIYRDYRNRIQKLKKEIKIDEKIKSLQQSALKAQMNPHFIFNCLNSIQGYVAAGDKEKATRFLARFAKLIRNVLDATIQNEQITLERDIDILKHYLTLEKMRFKDRFNYAIHLSPGVDCSNILVLPLLLQPYVENAIIHGISNISVSGKIEITYHQEDHQLIVDLVDNGIGINQATKTKTFNNHGHKSVGMSISRKRLELLNKKIAKQHLSIQELTDAQGQVTGTHIRLHIDI